MYIERSIYGLCAALLILFVRMDDLENDGDEGKQVMYGFAVMFGLLAVFRPFVWLRGMTINDGDPRQPFCQSRQVIPNNIETRKDIEHQHLSAQPPYVLL